MIGPTYSSFVLYRTKSYGCLVTPEKNVNVTVTDNDGAQSLSLLRVQVLNQPPVAQFEVRDSSLQVVQ